MEDNNKIIDWWTTIHFLGGFVIGSAIPKRKIGYSLILGYEVVENILMRSEAGDIFKEDEGIINAISDSIVGILAYELGKKYGKKKIGRY